MKQGIISSIKETEISKFLSFVLRHSPEKINLTLDECGWADTVDLMNKLRVNGVDISLEDLKYIVNNNKRFSFSDDLSKIRANHGHSINVDLSLKPAIPPNILFHGTAAKNLYKIKKEGILKGKRQYVHLSIDYLSAKKIGSRHGKPIAIQIDALKMHIDGCIFFMSVNNTWLTNSVPPKYFIEAPENLDKLPQHFY